MQLEELNLCLVAPWTMPYRARQLLHTALMRRADLGLQHTASATTTAPEHARQTPRKFSFSSRKFSSIAKLTSFCFTRSSAYTHFWDEPTTDIQGHQVGAGHDRRRMYFIVPVRGGRLTSRSSLPFENYRKNSLMWFEIDLKSKYLKSNYKPRPNKTVQF